VRSDEDRITVRQVADDRVLFSLPSAGTSTYSVFSSDGRFLAVTYIRRKRGPYLHIWDRNSRQLVVEVPGNESEHVAFSPDSRRVAVPQGRAGVGIYDLESGKEVQRLGKGTDHGWVAFHLKEALVAIAGPERNVEIWAVDTGQLVKKLSHPRDLGALAWGDGGRLLAVGMYGGSIQVWEAASWRRLAELRGHTGAVVRVFFQPTENVLISSAWDDTTRLWDPVGGRQLLVAPGFVETVRADGRQLAFRQGGQLGLWDMTLSTACRTLVYSPPQREDDYFGPFGLAYHPRGRLLAAGGDDGVRLWDPLTGRERAHLLTKPVDTVLFRPEGTHLIAYGEGGLCSWALRSDPGGAGDGLPHGPARLLEGPKNPDWYRRACCWCPGEGTLAVVANQGESLVVVQPFEGPGEVVHFKGRPINGRPVRLSSVAVSGDGRWLAGGGPSGITVWERATAKVVTELPGSHPGSNTTTVLFSPDGKWLVAGGQGEYRFWQVGTWEDGVEISRHHLENQPGTMAFTRDGKVLAAAWSRDLVRLYDGSNGQELATLTSPDPHRITKLCFSPDEDQLAVATQNYAVHVWDLRGLRAQLAELGLDWDSPP
jgi:WD40 repeat protein